MKKLGILTAANGAGSFRGNRANFLDLIREGKRQGWEVVVVPAESIVNRNSSMLRCFVRDGVRKRWVVKFSTLPDLFYNRIPLRDLENGPLVKQAKRWLTQQDIPCFNPGFFSKDALYKSILSSPEHRKLLPRTESYRFDRLSEWLDEEAEFYLKPVHGSLGEGIIRVNREGTSYHIERQTVGKRVNVGTFDAETVAAVLRTLTRKARYVLQRAVQLPRLGNSVYDLRTLVQRGKIGVWAVTGIGARVSEENGITTHVPNGGHIESSLSALKLTFGSGALSVYTRVEHQAVRLAEYISTVTPGLVGEMSLDLGIDAQGQVWFFEANAKPMKFDEPEIRSQSLQRIFEFGDYVTSNKVMQ